MAFDFRGFLASLPEIIKCLRQGDRVPVLYRSKPVLRIVPVEAVEQITLPLSIDPILIEGPLYLLPMVQMGKIFKPAAGTSPQEIENKIEGILIRYTIRYRLEVA